MTWCFLFPGFQHFFLGVAVNPLLFFVSGAAAGGDWPSGAWIARSVEGSWQNGMEIQEEMGWSKTSTVKVDEKNLWPDGISMNFPSHFYDYIDPGKVSLFQWNSCLDCSRKQGATLRIQFLLISCLNILLSHQKNIYLIKLQDSSTRWHSNISIYINN